MAKKLYRSQSDKIIAGVCGGLGEHFEVDPTIIRLIFILIVAFGGSGILIYLILWLLIPTGSRQEAIVTSEKIKEWGQDLKEKAEELKDNLEEKFHKSEQRDERHQRRGGLFGWVLIIFGALFLVNNFYPMWFRLHAFRYWPILVILAGLYLLIRDTK